ncbi:hypothetical protein [Clostridium sp. YIM B02555]|uniref:hypothetical protein n=1 Tax=Clostridium sp. YIM B02555 TaxID=2911968 RepID=UPI001EEF4F79|nr:hypothetical protein [Clostridium sp. YIM B02555]
MRSASVSSSRLVLGLFIGAMCLIYPQQIGGFVAKALGLFGDMFSRIVTPIFLKALGI